MRASSSCSTPPRRSARFRSAFGAAIEYAQALGLERIWTRVQALAETLRTRLAAVPGVSVRDLGVVRGGIVSFTVRGVDAARVKAALRAASINVTVSPARGTLLDMRARGLSEVLREIGRASCRERG